MPESAAFKLQGIVAHNRTPAAVSLFEPPRVCRRPQRPVSNSRVERASDYDDVVITLHISESSLQALDEHPTRWRLAER